MVAPVPNSHPNSQQGLQGLGVKCLRARAGKNEVVADCPLRETFNFELSVPLKGERKKKKKEKKKKQTNKLF